MAHFAHARVNLDALTGNARLLGERAGGTPLMGVVKADGYGHGMLPAARALIAGGASWLGTAFIHEGLALRRAGITVPILTWIIPPGEPVGDAIEADRSEERRVGKEGRTRWGREQ